jgi:hypothetical protein
MAELRPLHIASTTPGMFWRVTSYKPAGKPAYVSAYEGRDVGDGCWSCDLMGCRSFRQEAAGGRATKSALLDAARTLLSDMASRGDIAKADLPASRPAAA